MSRWPKAPSWDTCVFYILRAARQGHGGQDVAGNDLLDRDGSLPAAAAQKRERPVHERRQPILEAGQEGEMDDEPEDPRRCARQPEPAEIRDGAKPCDRRQRSEIAIDEWSRLRTSTQPPYDCPSGMPPRLHRDFGHSGIVVQLHEVSDDEDLGMPGKRAVWKDFDAARAINGRAACRREQPSKRRRLDSGCPNLRARLQPHRRPSGWLQIQADRINARHSRAQLQFDAELAKVACRALA